MTQPEEVSKAGLVVSIVGIIVGAVMVYLVVCAFIAATPIGTEYTNRVVDTPIRSLSDTSMIKGRFFLGTGGISENMYYTYYEGITTFKLKRVSVDYTTVIMDENEHPYLRTITSMYQERYRDGSVSTPNRNLWKPETYELHVPSGTIVDQYTLDGV